MLELEQPGVGGVGCIWWDQNSFVEWTWLSYLYLVMVSVRLTVGILEFWRFENKWACNAHLGFYQKERSQFKSRLGKQGNNAFNCICYDGTFDWSSLSLLCKPFLSLELFFFLYIFFVIIKEDRTNWNVLWYCMAIVGFFFCFVFCLSEFRVKRR